MIRLLPIDAATYEPSSCRAPDRIWIETNCYVDLWIELLHALGLDYRAALAFTLSVDFEGDQWQFFKFPPEDLRKIFGLEVAEMNPWRGLEHHVEEQLGMGRLLTAEVDSFHLPDTAGISYDIEHVKTTIAPNMIDRARHRLGYFHNSGYHELGGDDYAGLFGHKRDQPEVLLPYVELLKLDGLSRPDDRELLDTTIALVREHLSRRPASNPVQRFTKRLEQDVDWLRSEGLETFHQYAFATLRQFGSAAELSGSLCQWLAQRGEPTADAGREWSELASQAKAAMFQLARLMNGKRALDVDALLVPMEHRWDAAMAGLVDRYQ
jgi:Domain of unknown function (DUF1839)